MVKKFVVWITTMERHFAYLRYKNVITHVTEAKKETPLSGDVNN